MGDSDDDTHLHADHRPYDSDFPQSATAKETPAVDILDRSLSRAPEAERSPGLTVSAPHVFHARARASSRTDHTRIVPPLWLDFSSRAQALRSTRISNRLKLKRVQIVQSVADGAGREGVPVAAEVPDLRDDEDETALSQTVRPGGHIAMAFQGDAGAYLAIGVVSRMGIMKAGRISTEYVRPVPMFEVPDNFGFIARWLTPDATRTRWRLVDGPWSRDSTVYSLDYYVGVPYLQWLAAEDVYELDGGEAQVEQYNAALRKMVALAEPEASPESQPKKRKKMTKAAEVVEPSIDSAAASSARAERAGRRG